MGILDFWRKRKAATAPGSGLFGLLTAGQPSARVRVDPTSAMQTAAVYACVRVVSEDVAKLPLCIYRRERGGSRREAADHPLHRLFRDGPNAWQSAYEFKELMQAHLELRGNAFAYIVRDGGGRILSLVPVHPDRVTVWVQDDGVPLYKVTRPEFGYPVPPEVRAGDMLHVRGQSFDGYLGLSPLAWLRETIGIAVAADQYAGAYFGNGARPDFVIRAKNTPLTPDQVEKIRHGWEKNYQGVSNAHRPAVLPGDMELQMLGASNRDSQFLELRQFQVADIARAFRIPLHKIGSLERATFSNIEQQSLEYFQDGLMPRLERFEAALQRDLLTDQERDGFEVEFDFAEIIRGDMESTLKAIALGRNWGILSSNTGRSWLNLDPRVGGDDDYLAPTNMTPADRLGDLDRGRLAELAAAAGVIGARAT